MTPIPNPLPAPFALEINPAAPYLRYFFGNGPPGSTAQWKSYARVLCLYAGSITPPEEAPIPLAAPLARFGMRYGAVAIQRGARWLPQRTWLLPDP